MNITLLIISISLFLLCIWFLSIIVDKNEDIKKLKAEIARKEKIEKQKEKINTNDDNTNFNNSIELLQNYSKNRN